MKLLLVSESYWPNLDGGAVFQRRLAHGLTERGHHVAVWAPGQSFRSSVEQDGPVRIYRERAFPAPGNARYWFSLWPFWHGYRIVARERPDVIHVHAPSQIGVAALMAARRYRIPVVATNHVMPENLVTPQLPRPLFRLGAALIWHYIIWFHNRTRYVTTPSPTALRYLKQHHLRPPAVTISNGLELDMYKPPTKRPVNKPPILLYVGRLDPEKDVTTLIEAAALLKAQLDFRFEIIGHGTQLEKLKQLAEASGLSSIVTFRGRLSDTDKIKAYQSADVFIIASPAELQSIVTLEAMACGLAVVAANAGALPDLVTNSTGLLAQPHDPQAFAAAGYRLLTDSALRRSASKAATQSIHDNHSTTKTFDAYEAIYKKIGQQAPADPVERPA